MPEYLVVQKSCRSCRYPAMVHLPFLFFPSLCSRLVRLKNPSLHSSCYLIAQSVKRAFEMKRPYSAQSYRTHRQFTNPYLSIHLSSPLSHRTSLSSRWWSHLIHFRSIELLLQLIINIHSLPYSSLLPYLFECVLLIPSEDYIDIMRISSVSSSLQCRSTTSLSLNESWL